MKFQNEAESMAWAAFASAAARRGLNRERASEEADRCLEELRARTPNGEETARGS